MRLAFVALASALLLGAAPAAQAAGPRYATATFTSPVSSALTAKAPLEDFVMAVGARLIVRADWKPLSTRSGQLRYLTPGTSCRYVVTFTARPLLAAPADSVDRVAALLPSPGRGRLLDRGERGGSAWRVTRPSSIGERVRLRSLRVAVLTRREVVVPSGQVAWSELRASATSRAGDECHAGTWRDGLGPQLGDVLATAKMRQNFVRKP